MEGIAEPTDSGASGAVGAADFVAEAGGTITGTRDNTIRFQVVSFCREPGGGTPEPPVSTSQPR